MIALPRVMALYIAGMDALKAPLADGGSDYGSEISPEDADALIELLAQADSASVLDGDDIEHDYSPQGAHLPRRSRHEKPDYPYSCSTVSTSACDQTTVRVSQAGGDSSNHKSIESDASRSTRQVSAPIKSPQATPEPDTPDLRSPLERFRSKPKKALSVTDLVSPSWCELQYWYVLTKHGRKRRTPAMRQGSAVHKALEDQVHRTIPVDIQTKEDALGLRIWNVIQGLKTLRETGMTRELEVWGVIDGLVVNGIIDELSYICPDRELEEEVTARTAHPNARKNVPAVDQSTITSFLTSPGKQSGILKDLRFMRKKTDKIYLTDVKTRGAKTVPTGSSFRPTLMQLMLYHFMLSDLASNRVSTETLFARYELDPKKVFSDSFIAQVGSLNETFYDAPDSPPQSSQDLPDTTQDSMTLLLEHNTLASLWSHMIQEFAHTMPAGAASIGSVLKAEYRDASTGDIMGVKTFLYDKDVINDYLNDGMRWWRGEREARGVDVEEAYKCRSCEFNEGCEWRNTKIEEAVTMMRTRTRSTV